jgi:hypothetical protein
MARWHAIVGFGLLVACGVSDRITPPDASRQDAFVPDAVPVGSQCDYGTLVADVFGNTVLWNGGAPLPAGHYTITYTDGCMEYSYSGQGWTVNAVVGATGCVNGLGTLYVTANGAPLTPAPGTVGCLLGEGASASFDACVAANQATDVPLEFDFAGGTLGLWLQDAPYDDNVAGESGRSPTYRLTSACGATPQACDWTTPFDSVTPITELNNPPGASELRLSQDELTGYFDRDTEIYVTSRASTSAPFAPPALATDVSSSFFDAAPFLSSDGLSLYLSSGRPGTLGGRDIFVATRATTSSVFSAPVDLPSVSSPTDDATPYVTNDGSELWLASSRAGESQLYRALSGGGGFGAASAVGELSVPGTVDSNPVLTADGLTLYFSSNRGGSTAIYVAHRASMTALFAPPTLVTEISTTGNDYASWISPDSCRLYMMSRTGAGDQLYVAARQMQ